MIASRQIDTPIRSAGDYLDRIGKIVPPEITGAYLAVQPLLLDPIDITKHFHVLLAFAGFLTILVPLYLWRVGGVTNSVQLAFSALSFPVWAASMSAEQLIIRSDGAVSGAVVTVVMVGWALLIPIFVPARATGNT